MAYSTSNPPRLFSQSIGSSYGSVYYYTSTDALATVLATGYFTNGYSLGIRTNDVVIMVDETLGQTRLLYVSLSSLTTDAATVTASTTQLNTSGVVSGSGATVTLTAAQSGKTILLDRAAGIAFTLPVPVVGLKFKFVTTTSVTSNAYSVTTTASVFLVGHVETIIGASATTIGNVANGTSITAISSNGTTTGGLIGGVFELECVTATQWAINGIIVGSGSVATPFA